MPLPIYATSTNQKAPLGDELVVSANRVYRYAKNGRASLAAGTVVQAGKPNASHANLTCAATAADATSIIVTLGSALVDANEYKQGYIYINDADGAGYLYDIRSHPTAAPAASLKLQLRDQVVEALTTSSQATLHKNIYNGVTIPGGSQWDITAGVVPTAIPANEYFWCQVRGPAAVLEEGGLFAGRGVMLSPFQPGAFAVAKQVIPEATTTPVNRAAGSLIADSTPGEANVFSQKAIEKRIGGDARVDPDELLVDITGKAVVPERILGYCINPRVGTEYALVYLTIN